MLGRAPFGFARLPAIALAVAALVPWGLSLAVPGGVAPAAAAGSSSSSWGGRAQADVGPRAAEARVVDFPNQVSPPPTIASDCSRNVSYPMEHWLNSLGPGTVVVAPPRACYLVNQGVTLHSAFELTISGGIWVDQTTPVPGANPNQMHAVFWLIGGSNITLENLIVTGNDVSGTYFPPGAFEAAIRSDGVIALTVAGVFVHDVWGDGVELNVLRGAQDDSGQIIRPSTNVSVSNVFVDGAGRTGISFGGAQDVSITGVHLARVGINDFDVEADQRNEGAVDVTINGCTADVAGALFFANGGAGGGGRTRDITVENCTMFDEEGGDAIYVQDIPASPKPRGPFLFLNDTLRCGDSAYVSCVQSTGGTVKIENSLLLFPFGTAHEPVYHAVNTTSLDFESDTVAGYGSLGTLDQSSNVTVEGGTWVPWPGG
jgi:hypothetical protein